MGDNITISTLSVSAIEAHPTSIYPNLFTSPAWLKTLINQYDFDYFCVREDESANLLAAAKIEQFGLTKIKVFPFCDYIIPSAQNAQTLTALIRGLEERFPETSIQLKIMLPGGITKDELPFHLEHTAYRHAVDTTGNIQSIEDNMDSSFMRGVRKAESNELDISLSTEPKALERFYDIYCKQRISKFGKLPQPYSFFQQIHTNFMAKGNGFVLQARSDATVIASMIILGHHQTLYYKFGCSLQPYLHLRPNNLLFHQLFKYAQENNFREVDLGLSGVSDDYKGLVRFKEYMGGQPNNIYSLQLNKDKNSKAKKQLNTFMSTLTQTIVEQEPNAATASAFSETLYPFFA